MQSRTRVEADVTRELLLHRRPNSPTFPPVLPSFPRNAFVRPTIFPPLFLFFSHARETFTVTQRATSPQLRFCKRALFKAGSKLSLPATSLAGSLQFSLLHYRALNILVYGREKKNVQTFHDTWFELTPCGIY